MFTLLLFNISYVYSKMQRTLFLKYNTCNNLIICIKRTVIFIRYTLLSKIMYAFNCILYDVIYTLANILIQSMLRSGGYV